MKHVLSCVRALVGACTLLAASNLFASSTSPSGQLDTSFASTGKAQFNYKTVTVASDSRAIIQQASGKVVIGGGSNNGIYKDYLVMRMNPDGTLDPSFGVGSFGLPGVTIVDMSFDDHINGLAQNSDGSRFCGGGISNWDFGIACFTRDGILDTTFNSSGTPPGTFKSNAPGSGGGGRILGMTFDRSDRLVAIGYAPGPTTRDVFLHRFNTNGTDDNSFGTNGWVRLDIGSSDRGFDVAVLKGATVATDQLVAVGTSGSHVFIAVLNANGSLDTSSHALTGTNGYFNPSVNPQGETIFEGVAVDSSNNIYVTGQGSSGGFYVQKYNLANAAAIAQTGNLGGASSSNDVGFRVRIATVAGNERVYASGTSNAGVDFDVARLTLGLATEFNTSTSLSSGSDFAYDVAVNQSTGYVTATGVTFGDLNTVGVTRYNPSGNLDTGFNGTGKYYAQIQGGSGDFPAAFAVQSDGNAILAGTTFTSNGDYDLLVTRVKTDGTRDTSCWASGTAGWDQRGFSAGSAEQMNPGGVAIDSNGKAVVVGSSNGYFAVRYNTNGTLDTSFDTDGIVLGSWGANSEGKVVAIDSGNNVIVGGDITLNGDFKVSRLAASNGALDTTFGASGIATVDISAGKSDVLKAIAIDTSGRIVLGGECIVHVVTTDFFKMCLARLTSAGVLDTTFNGTGKVLLNISGNDTFDIRSLQLLPDLDTPSATDYKIVVAGQYVQSSPSQAMWLIARFNMNGSLDTSFNGTGYKTLVPGFDTTTSKPYTGSANSVALQYDEKLIVVGESAQPDPLNSCCVLARLITVARLNWDGSLDTTYGTSSANPGFTYTSFGSDPSEAYQAYVYPQSNSALKGRALLTPFIIASDFAMARYREDPAVTNPDTSQAPVLLTGDDSGRLNNDNYTNVTTPHFTGTCGQGDTVYILVGGNQTQPRSRGICSAAGTYNVQIAAPLIGNPAAQYSITSRAQNGIGDSVVSPTPLSVTIDTVVAAPGIAAPTAGAVVNQNPTISGSGEHDASVVVTGAVGEFGAGCTANYADSSTGAWSCASTFEQGAHNISVVQTDLAGNVSTATTRSFTVKVPTTTTIGVDVNPSRYGQTVTFTATVTPVAGNAIHASLNGTSIRFQVDGADAFTTTLNASGVATFATNSLSVATHTVNAFYDENASWFGSNTTAAPVSQTVIKADTTTTIGSSANPSVFGQAITFTANVTANAPGGGTPDGSVTFTYDGNPTIVALSGGSAQFSPTTPQSVGPHTLTVNYPGSASYNPSTNGLSQTVNKANTATAVSSSQNPSKINQSVTFTATVTAVSPGAGVPGGTVTFFDGSTQIGTGTLSAGVASASTNTLTLGTHTITATYSGDGNFNGNNNGSLNSNPQIVVAPPTISKSFSPKTIPLNSNSTLSFTVTNPNTASALSGLAFTDSLPGGVQLASTTVTGSCGSGTITATINNPPGSPSTVSLSGGTLTASPDPASSCTFSVSVTGISAGAQVNTTSTVSSTEGGTGGTASDTLTVVAPPTISKSFSPKTIPLNGNSTLSFTITNPNTVSALSGVAFTDSLPGGAELASTTVTGSCGSGTITATTNSPPGSPSTVSLSGGTLTASPGAGSSCTFSVSVTGISAGAQVNTTSAVSSTEGGTGGTASDTLTVLAPPTISKHFGHTTVPLSQSDTLSFTVANPNTTNALSGVAFTDSLPGGLKLASSTVTGACGSGTITATINNPPASPSTVSLSGGTLTASPDAAS